MPDDRRLALPSLTVHSAASLPPRTQTWPWAHVHTNKAFESATDFERFFKSLGEPDNPNADRIPRRLGVSGAGAMARAKASPSL